MAMERRGEALLHKSSVRLRGTQTRLERYCQELWISDRRDQAASFRSSSLLRSFLNPIDERDAGAYEWKQVRAVETSPPVLRHLKQLVGHQQPLGA